MHIGINTLGMPIGNTGGLQTYTEELIRALAKVDQANHYTIFVHKDAGAHYYVDNPNFRYVYCNIPQNWLRWSVIWRNSFFYFVVKKTKIDLLHSPANLAPFFLPCPSVLTVHDAISFKETYSVTTSFLRRYFWPLVIKRGIQKAHGVITVSNTSKSDLLRFVSVTSNKIRVIYNGVPSFLDKDCLEGQNGFTKPYILWVGKILAHKNLIRLIQAYHILVKQKGIKHDLYLVGMKGFHDKNVMREIKKLDLKNRGWILNFQQRHKLKYFYENASIFVFPSLIEGFGLPLLEAMSCGVPVVTSHRGAMKEIAADAAYFVDPENVEDIAQGMWDVLSNEHLRQELIEKGRKRIQSFSWEKCAHQTLEMYKTTG